VSGFLPVGNPAIIESPAGGLILRGLSAGGFFIFRGWRVIAAARTQLRSRSLELHNSAVAYVKKLLQPG
jgi:hypothetical protein